MTCEEYSDGRHHDHSPDSLNSPDFCTHEEPYTISIV
jgi:hypothetical protein